MRKIAIDVDSVLADIMTPLLPILNKKHGTNLQISDIKEWNHTVNGNSIGHYIRSFLADPAFVLSMPEVEGSRSAMAELYKKNEIAIATGRPTFCKNNTMKWLDGRFLYDKIIFSKEKTTKNLQCDVLLDDSPSYLSKFIKSGGKGILFSRPWNENNVPDGCNCVVDSWTEALEAINGD
jgi:5'(3')-deoxyribonucleotidase